MTDCAQRVLNARAALYKALQDHHAFITKHTEILQLADEFEALKGLIPPLSGMHSVPVDNDRTVSASCAHADVVTSLQETLDMHASCVCLLEVHQAIDVLSTAVRQLCQCVKKTHSWEPEQDEWGWHEAEKFDEDFVRPANDAELMEKSGTHRFPHSETCEIDADAYRLCTSDVVSALHEVERLLNQSTKFDKDSTTVFQGFYRTLRDCKLTLYDHIDELWCQWIVWYTPTQPTSEGKHGMGLSQLLSDLRLITEDELIGATIPTTKVISNLLVPSIDKIHQPDFGPFKRSTSMLANLTVLAKPKLLTQLFRLVNALGDSSGRFGELSSLLWRRIFKPWLERDASTSGSSNSDANWPMLRTRYFDDSSVRNNDFEGFDEDDCCEPPHLLPAWRLELVSSPDCAFDEGDALILDSCRQLASSFEDLSTHLFSLREPGDSTVPVCIGDCFDEYLVKELIGGRFTAVLPSAKECGSPNFLAPVTQVVYSLAVTGKETGFFTGSLDEDCFTHSISGGASMLLHWVHSLSKLTENRRTGEIIARVRALLADREQFHETYLVGTQSCPKPTSVDNGQLEFSELDERLDDEDVLVYQKHTNEVSGCHAPSLTRLLESKANRGDLARYLDLRHFYFPLCKVSKAIPALMDVINQVIADAESCLDRSGLHGSDHGLTAQEETALRNNSYTLAATTVELVPRLILFYPFLTPTFHATELERDLYLASLYHNNCMYLAHECLTLSETSLYPMLRKIQPAAKEDDMVEKTGDGSVTDQTDLERLAAASTCILVPLLRTCGANMLIRHLQNYREKLVTLLSNTRGFRDVGLAENGRRCADAMNSCFDLLRVASCGLRPLSLSLYYRCMGILCNCVCKEVTGSVLRLIDLTTLDCDVLVGFLRDVETEIDEYFGRCPDPDLRPTDMPETEKQHVDLVMRRVPELARIRGVIAVLTAPGMTVIERVLWNLGTGPLFTEWHLNASELRALIEAAYVQSATRYQFLSMLH